MKRKFNFAFVVVVLCLTLFLISMSIKKLSEKTAVKTPTNASTKKPLIYDAFPFSIVNERSRSYLGSDFKIEQTLPDGTNYKQYVASYMSDDLKIYGLLSVPTSQKPKDGYPAIIFNHGYIPPEEYRTTERYVAYFADIANSGYVVFKPDYRGNGSSEGQPESAYYSPGYTDDVLNAVASVKKLKEVNKQKIGMWGHSMGGFLTLRAMVISKDIKVGVIWGGVVGSYQDFFDNWWSKRDRQPFSPSEREKQANRPSRDTLSKLYGAPSDKSAFWKSISANSYLNDISGPLQLHHGLSDETVPPILSQKLYNSLISLHKEVEYYTYVGNDHNISLSYATAMGRTIEFFDKYLK